MAWYLDKHVDKITLPGVDVGVMRKSLSLSGNESWSFSP
jgi:hypothetical protein